MLQLPEFNKKVFFLSEQAVKYGKSQFDCIKMMQVFNKIYYSM
jgi:hypothetical protein